VRTLDGSWKLESEAAEEFDTRVHGAVDSTSHYFFLAASFLAENE
jgi:hypothetical protein